MLIELAPHVRLLEAAAETMRQVDYEDRAGTAKAVTVRHARNRKPVRAEKPALSLILVGDDPRPDELNRNAWERVRELQFDIQADADLATEDSDEDPTGLALLSRMLAAAVQRLEVSFRDEATPLNQLCDYVSAGSIDPDEKSREDDGRLVRGLTVLYRVRADDSNVLLGPGENA